MILVKIVPETDYNEWKKPIGIWKVSTEGDVEGRSTQVLGFFEGDIYEIIKELNDKIYYNFFIEKYKKVTSSFESDSSLKPVSVYVDSWKIDTKKHKDKHEIAKALFQRSDTHLKFFDSSSEVKIFYGEKAKEEKTKERQKEIEKAMSKLTDREKKLLGLNRIL